MIRAFAHAAALLFGPPRPLHGARIVLVATGEDREVQAALAAVRARFPDAGVSAVGLPGAAGLTSLAGRLPPLDRGAFPLVRRARVAPFDVAVVIWDGRGAHRAWKLLGAFGLLSRAVAILDETGAVFTLDRAHLPLLLRLVRRRLAAALARLTPRRLAGALLIAVATPWLLAWRGRFVRRLGAPPEPGAARAPEAPEGEDRR